eukprot:357241-Chlamydomonas_euryale.AAC.12
MKLSTGSAFRAQQTHCAANAARRVPARDIAKVNARPAQRRRPSEGERAFRSPPTPPVLAGAPWQRCFALRARAARTGSCRRWASSCGRAARGALHLPRTPALHCNARRVHSHRM